MLDQIKEYILGRLVSDFQNRKLSIMDLKNGYEGLPLPPLRQDSDFDLVNFDLAFEELEKAKQIKTGPYVPYENKPGSSIHIFFAFQQKGICVADRTWLQSSTQAHSSVGTNQT